MPVTLVYLAGGIKGRYIHHFRLSVSTPDMSYSVVFDGFLLLHAFNPV